VTVAFIFRVDEIRDMTLKIPVTGNLEITGKFQRFSTAIVHQFTPGIPVPSVRSMSEQFSSRTQ
jgi:hypothetical protein